jgi:hypothetical protein
MPDDKDLKTAVRKAWRLLRAVEQQLRVRDVSTRAERYAEIARDLLAEALKEPAGFRAARTETNEPAPRDALDRDAERLMGSDDRVRSGKRPTNTRELKRAARKVWLLLGGAGHWETILALLPAGGRVCHQWTQVACDVLGEVLGEERLLQADRRN